MADEHPAVSLSDYTSRYGTPADESRTEALLADAADLVVSLYERRHGAAWIEGEHPEFDRSFASVCCAAVHRAVDVPSAFAGASQYQQTAGSYSASVTLANPSGDIYVSRSDLRRLGLSGCRVRSIAPMTAADRG